MITLLRQATFWAIVPAVAQGLPDLCPAHARLACPPRINHQHLAPGAFSLGAKYLLEARPSGISNRSGQPAVLEHPLDVQAFRSDQTESTNQTNSHLVVVFLAKVGHTGVQLGNLLASLPAVAPAFLLPAEASTQPSQLWEFSLEVLGIDNRLAVAGGQEVRESDINANLRVRLLNDIQFAKVAGKDHEPLATFTLGGDRFDFALPRAVKLDLHNANVLQIQAVARDPAAVAVRGELKTVKVVSTLESGKTSFGGLCLHSAKEVGVSFVEAAHSPLCSREVDFCVELVCPTSRLEPLGLVVKSNRLAGELVSLDALRQAFVVQAPVSLQGNRELALLISVGEQAIFECLAHESPAFLVLDIPCDNGLANRSNRASVVTPAPKGRKPAPQLTKFLPERSGRVPLDPVDNLGHANSWATFKKNVHVIRHHTEIVHGDLQLETFLPDQLTKPVLNRSNKDGPPVLGAPHNVVLQAENCAGVFAVSRFHTALYACQINTVHLEPENILEGAHSPVA